MLKELWSCRVAAKAPLEVAAAPSFLNRFASAGPRRPRMPNQLLLSSYVPSYEWVPPSADTEALERSLTVGAPLKRGSLWSRTYATSTPLFSGC